MYWRDWLLLRKTGDKFGDFRPKAGDFWKNIFGNTVQLESNSVQHKQILFPIWFCRQLRHGIQTKLQTIL